MACSRDVISEAIARLRDDHPDWPGAQITNLMDGFLSSFNLVDDFDPTIPFAGSDQGDRHVHAAAIAAGASFLVTDDNGFHRLDSDETPYEAITADAFLVLVDDSHPHIVAEATRAQLKYWASRRERADLASHLVLAGCPEFAERVDSHVQVQAGTLSRQERRAALGKEDLQSGAASQNAQSGISAPG